MPQYQGDYGYILPDNSANLRHIGDQFFELQQQQRLEQQRQAQADKERQAGAFAYLNNALDPAKYGSSDLMKGILNQRIGKMKEKYLPLVKTLSAPDVASIINDDVAGLKGYMENSKSIDENITKGVAELIKRDPGLDYGTLVDLAKHDAMFTKDANGNSIEKPELDASKDWIGETLKNHPDKIGTYGDVALKNLLKDSTQNEETIPSKYDDKGNLIQQGGYIKYPDFTEKKYDDKGNLLKPGLITKPYLVNGTAVTRLERGADGKMKPVPDEVVPEAAFKLAMRTPSTAINVIKEMSEQFPGVEPDSPQGQFLQRKILTAKMQQYSGVVHRPEDESAKRKKDYFNDQEKLKADKRAEESLRIQNAKLDHLVNKGDDTAPRDPYKELDDYFTDNPTSTGIPGNILNTEQQALIMAAVNKDKKDEDKLQPNQVFVRKEPGRKMEVHRLPTDVTGEKVEGKDAILATVVPENLIIPANKGSKPERQSGLKKAQTYIKDATNKLINKVTGKAPSKISGLDEGALN